MSKVVGPRGVLTECAFEIMHVWSERRIWGRVMTMMHV